MAKDIIDAAKSIDISIGQLDNLISSMENIEERDIWLNRLGNVMYAIYDEIFDNIYKDFPDLIE
jgi:type III secretion system FlhB-like substrate exporter